MMSTCEHSEAQDTQIYPGNVSRLTFMKRIFVKLEKNFRLTHLDRMFDIFRDDKYFQKNPHETKSLQDENDPCWKMKGYMRQWSNGHLKK